MRCSRECSIRNQLCKLFSSEFAVTFTSTANQNRTQILSNYIHVYHRTPQLLDRTDHLSHEIFFSVSVWCEILLLLDRVGVRTTESLWFFVFVTRVFRSHPSYPIVLVSDKQQKFQPNRQNIWLILSIVLNSSNRVYVACKSIHN